MYGVVQHMYGVARVPQVDWIIDMRALTRSLGRPLSKSLLPYHALTCWDTVSCFSGRGKTEGFEILKKLMRANSVHSLHSLETMLLHQHSTLKKQKHLCVACMDTCETVPMIWNLKCSLLHKKKPPPLKLKVCPHHLHASYQTFI